MLIGQSIQVQAILGTLFTWALTAAGAAVVFLIPASLPNRTVRRILDASLGFAAGVMLAASYWSLLEPAFESAKSYGDLAIVPVSVGFVLGAFFVYIGDMFIPEADFTKIDDPRDPKSSPQPPMTNLESIKIEHKRSSSPATAILRPSPGNENINNNNTNNNNDSISDLTAVDQNLGGGGGSTRKRITNRRRASPQRSSSPRSESSSTTTTATTATTTTPNLIDQDRPENLVDLRKSWKRILLLVLAITIHNFPEGLAVGVGFASMKDANDKLSFATARNLAIGVGIQNFPEGLAVSLPLRRLGFSPLQSFWYGQLSGMVEPIAGIFGATMISIAEPLLPYALAFAAGAMIFVVVDDLIPEATSSANSSLCSWGCIIGFIVMMSLDVML